MTPEFKTKWLEALRSGKYQQARGTLKDYEGAMCCLGVAADLIDHSAWTGRGWNHCMHDTVGTVAKALGITVETAQELSTRNDGSEGQAQHSFAQIADYIEANL